MRSGSRRAEGRYTPSKNIKKHQKTSNSIKFHQKTSNSMKFYQIL
nr:MAG TPA: hypothetical protein [Caudoviricetes sp.]